MSWGVDSPHADDEQSLCAVGKVIVVRGVEALSGVSVVGIDCEFAGYGDSSRVTLIQIATMGNGVSVKLSRAFLPLPASADRQRRCSGSFCQAEKEGTVEPLVPWTVVGRPVDGRRTAGGRSSAARVSSAAPKKKSFDRGGPVWPPRSNVTNDRLRGGLGGLCFHSLSLWAL